MKTNTTTNLWSFYITKTNFCNDLIHFNRFCFARDDTNLKKKKKVKPALKTLVEANTHTTISELAKELDASIGSIFEHLESLRS